MRTSRKRIVVKAGSSSLAAAGGGCDDAKIAGLVDAIVRLTHAGHEVLLVSSGAVASGFSLLGFKQRPRTLAAKQAAAAIGQGVLMQSYAQRFAAHGLTVAQILLTRGDFSDRERYNHAYHTLSLLLTRGVIPIVNENDTVSVAELTFGDNDMLGALVAGLVHADLYIILTDTNGLYDKDPRKHPDARRIPCLMEVTAEAEAAAGSAGALGTGGMRSKLLAAKTAQTLGIPSFIGRLGASDSLLAIVAGAGDGTYVGWDPQPFQAPHQRPDSGGRAGLPTRKQWIALHSTVSGRLYVDDGAAEAIVKRRRSLLAAGVQDVQGTFQRGDVVEVYNADRLLGRGICRYGANELRVALSPGSGLRLEAEVIHRDHWVTLSGLAGGREKHEESREKHEETRGVAEMRNDGWTQEMSGITGDTAAGTPIAGQHAPVADSVRQSVAQQARLAKRAAREWALLPRERKDEALRAIGWQLQADQRLILAANAEDVDRAAAAGQPNSYLDRLRLTPERIAALAESLEALAQLPDPIGDIAASWTRPNGLLIRQVRVPLGVIGMVYEARPNVTVDAAAIALKTGNAIVLRGSRSASRSNTALVLSIKRALQALGLPHEAVQYVSAEQRESVDALCTLNGLIDVIIPRGGAGLINRVVRTSTVPVLETGVGNCHVFVDESAEYAMAEAIVLNAKTSRPAVCNAAETLLLHRDWPLAFSSALLRRLSEAGVELRACEQTRERHPQLAGRLRPAAQEDWDREYLELILAVKTVDSLDDALEHIARHGTSHSEAIVTQNDDNARRFLASVDAAAVYHNASTRFTDGGEFGFGAEIGISTQKIHARGPMGLLALTTIKYHVLGNGQTR